MPSSERLLVQIHQHGVLEDDGEIFAFLVKQGRQVNDENRAWHILNIDDDGGEDHYRKEIILLLSFLLCFLEKLLSHFDSLKSALVELSLS